MFLLYKIISSRRDATRQMYAEVTLIKSLKSKQRRPNSEAILFKFICGGREGRGKGARTNCPRKFEREMFRNL